MVYRNINSLECRASVENMNNYIVLYYHMLHIDVGKIHCLLMLTKYCPVMCKVNVSTVYYNLSAYF